MTTSKLLRHEACQECRKNGNDRRGNNLAVYTDHVYCFACGYTRKTGFNYLKRRQKEESDRSGCTEAYTVSKHTNQRPTIPSDVVLSLPSVALDWLYQYELTDREIAKHKLGWSENGILLRGEPYKPCLVFPVYDEQGECLMYQARYFGQKNNNVPKYVTRGNPNDILHILGNGGDTITIVEDLISAIKVSRYGISMPIWGSFLSNQVAMRISKQFVNLNIWLDYDKTKEAHKTARRVGGLFSGQVKVISTLRDPKGVPGKEILGYIGELG